MNDREIWNSIKQQVRLKIQDGKFKTSQHIYTIDMARQKMISKDTVCARCGGNDVLTIDHIVPISLLEDFDLLEQITDEENFQILCRRCNRFKADKLDFSTPKTKDLLIKYVNMIK